MEASRDTITSNGDSPVVINNSSDATTNTMHDTTDDIDTGATPRQSESATETERDRKASHSSGKDVERPSASGSRHGSELKPIGIINEQNTCFLNSTFQAVSLVYV